MNAVYAGQGACVEGTWARGQAWAICGYTMMYRETRDPRYLRRARRCADYWIADPNRPSDGIPYWDFKAADIPNEPRDASAAAIVASALLELCDYVPRDAMPAYRNEAVRMLLALTSDGYLAKPGENGGFLLMHSVGCKPKDSEVDVPLNYADYYLLEALLRLRMPLALDLVQDHPTSVWRRPLQTIRGKAQSLKKRKFSPITDKAILPPSGSKHDYISIGPYWWPDPSKPDGKPYVRRDGEVNPEYLNTDAARLNAVVGSVTWLTAAAVRLGDTTAGREAARRAKVFFLDEQTRMNPNLNYGQSIPGRCDGRGIGLIDTYQLASSDFLDALKVLHGFGYLEENDFSALQDWFAKFLEWMENSRIGQDEDRAPNNHGTAYDVQRIAYADFCGRREKARQVLSEAARRRIDGKITPEGRQPLEDARTKGVHYSMYQLDMYCYLSYFGERYGIDIWGHVTPNGATIATAMAFMRPYCFKEKPWPYKQIADFSPEIFDFCKITAEHFENIKESGK